MFIPLDHAACHRLAHRHLGQWRWGRSGSRLPAGGHQ
jgi:hypothetical protein